ncbi:MAG: hypothetical protein E7638_07495 [Ruminococcaceae bacterium]|nr:hypothetical protein [Oscillospiraceae bacterium]
MDLVGQIFALIAIPSTLILLVQSVLVIFGGDDDMDDGLDLTGNGEADTPGDGGGDGMALFSLRGIMAMGAVGGWSGLVMHQAGINLGVTILLACAFGFLALVGIAWIMKISSKLQSSGNIDLGYAIGKVGTVYIPIPPSMTGSGKVNLTIQERFVEVNAMTTSERKLTTGESVRVVATDETGMLVVEPVSK